MTRTFTDTQPIDVSVDDYGRPLVFIWHGRIHEIDRVYQSWSVDTDWWSEGGRTWCDYFAVTTRSGLLSVICHDWIVDVWQVVRLYD